MKELQRTKVGMFLIENAITIEEFKKRIDNNDLSNIISIEQIFELKDRIDLNNKLFNKYINGVQIKQDCNDDVYRIYLNDQFIGLGTVKDKKLKRDLVLL